MNKQDWIKKTQDWKNKWSVFLPEYNDDSKGINIYKFYEILNQNLKEDSVICWDAGSSLYCSNQALRLNGKGQRSLGSLAQSEMGAAISMSCGISFAKNYGEVICVIGDGSFHTQVNALAIVKKFNLPINIFVLQNKGYLSIKNSMDKFYEGRRIGTDSNDGYFFPQIRDIAYTYQINYIRIDKIKDFKQGFYLINKNIGPCICEVICPELQEIIPCMMPKKDKDGNNLEMGLDQMYPWLSEEEYNSEMIKD